MVTSTPDGSVGAAATKSAKFNDTMWTKVKHCFCRAPSHSCKDTDLKKHESSALNEVLGRGLCDGEAVEAAAGPGTRTSTNGWSKIGVLADLSGKTGCWRKGCVGVLTWATETKFLTECADALHVPGLPTCNALTPPESSSCRTKHHKDVLGKATDKLLDVIKRAPSNINHESSISIILILINHQPSIINHQPSIILINHQPSTINHQSSTIDHQSSSSISLILINHQPSVINHPPSIINHESASSSSTINYQPSVINHQPSIINHELSIILILIHHQPSTINHQSWISIILINHQPSTISHQPSTINHQSWIIHQHHPHPHPPSTINHQSWTSIILINHQPSTINHQSSTINHQSWIMKQHHPHQPSTINYQPSVINHQPSIINHQSSTINHQSSIMNHQSASSINYQPSVINHQPSTINHESSISIILILINHQPSIINHQPSIINHESIIIWVSSGRTSEVPSWLPKRWPAPHPIASPHRQARQVHWFSRYQGGLFDRQLYCIRPYQSYTLTGIHVDSERSKFLKWQKNWSAWLRCHKKAKRQTPEYADGKISNPNWGLWSWKALWRHFPVAVHEMTHGRRIFYQFNG